MENTGELAPTLPNTLTTDTSTIYVTASRLHDDLATNIYGRLQ